LKVGLFGGTFDPPTNDHIEILRYLLKEKIVDKIVVIPTYKNSFDKKSSDSIHRYSMINIAVENFKRLNNLTKYDIVVCGFEILNKIKLGTYESYTAMIEYYNKFEFNYKPFENVDDLYLIIGSDNMISINKWENHEKLLRDFKFIIIPRKNYKLKNSNQIITKDITKGISSTFVREKIKEYYQEGKLYRLIIEEDFKDYVDMSVFDYIVTNELYS
jgi:nicotinate-nucleotide adenylyltransferase